MNSFIVGVSSAMGPFFPLFFYKNKVNNLNEKILEKYANIEYYSKFGFISKTLLDEFRDLHIELEFYNYIVKQCEYLDNKFEERKAFINAKLAKAEIVPLPCISTLADNKNIYDNLSIEEIDLVNEHNLEYCDNCYSWIYHEFNHICIPVVNKPSHNIKLKKFVKGVPLQDDCRYCTVYDYYPVPAPERNPILVNRLKDIIKVFKIYRKIEINRIKEFILFDQINYDLIRKQPDVNTIYNILKLVDKYKFKMIDDDKPDDEPIYHAEDALEYFNVEDVDWYEKMREDMNERVFDPDSVVYSKLQRLVQCEMEEPHGDCNDLNQEQTSNVILTTHADDESVAQPVQVPQDNWERLCSPQHVQEYTQLMTRWQQFCSFEWSKDITNDGYLKWGTPSTKDTSWVLPLDFVNSRLDSPNCVLFKQYSYFRSDMEIKIVVNSNKFHCGALQASFYYGATLDKYYKDRANIYCASQISHCVIDAASASDGILKIPYRYYKPLMATTSRSDDNVVLDIGTLRLKVLNQLNPPTGDSNSVTVNMFIRFVNPSFHGMKPRDIGSIPTSQMMSMAKMVADVANLVTQEHPDPCRDNPTDIIPPKPMVPWSAHSWCIGDVLPEPSNPLRLQGTGNTPHPTGTLPVEPEMDIKYMSSIFGLIKQVKWSNDDTVGKILLKLPFSPVLDSYPTVVCKNPDEITCDVMPPVSVLSHMFAYWRGSLEYKLDFISTQWHTGRLIIAYLPRVVDTAAPTLEQLTYCDHIIVDLRDARQVLYSNSFLSDKPWWPRRSHVATSTEIYPPGYIYFAVVNRLTATAAVSKTITFNMYMRGGSDFELHIPTNPSIGLSFNTSYPKEDTSLITYIPAYGPPTTGLYAGNWHSVDGLVLRYGPVSDHVTQFDINKFSSYVLQLEDKNIKITAENLTFTHFVLFKLSGYCYMAPFTSQKAAQIFRRALSSEGEYTAGAGTLMTKAADGPYVNTMSTVYWKITNIQDPEEFVVINQMNDERKNVCGEEVQVQRNVMSTNQGMLTFGEKIYSIKQLLRRYAPYGQVISTQAVPTNPQLADFAFPVMPQGLDLLLKDSSGKWLPYGTKIRDGPISILASGYRFFRGSVRYRIAFDSNLPSAMWINHRPDYKLTSTNVYVPDKKIAEAVFQPGYASLIQFSHMNNVVEFEVPFYLPGQFGLLQRPDLTKVEDAVHYSMGTIFIGVDTINNTAKETPFLAEIFYSMGDDMSFTVFQGFPPMFSLDIFRKPYAQGWFDNLLGQVTDKVVDNVSKKVNDKIGVAVDEIQAEEALTASSSKAETDGVLTMIKTHLKGIDEAKQQTILAIFSQLIHAMINPSISQIAWSIASIFLHMGLIAVSCLQSLTNAFSKMLKFFNVLSNKSTKSEQDSKTTVSQGPDDEEAEKVQAAFVATCVTSMLSLGHCSSKPLPKTLPNFATYLYEGLPKFTLSANGLYTFFKNNLTMFKKIWVWLMTKFNKGYIFAAELENCDDQVREFIVGTQWCLEAHNAKQLRSDPKASTKVYELANLAQVYLAKKAMSTLQKPMPTFEMYCRKIIALRDELTREMLSPPIRFEPFVICLQGPSNVGKSHLGQNLGQELLKSIGFQSYEEIVYTRTPGNAYWNNLSNQPICIFDDFLNFESETLAHLSLTELYCLKSKAVFNPPMAAIDEKKIRYNPLIVILCCNKAFPKIDNVAVEEAWFRRRDVMFKCVKKPEYKSKHPRFLPKDIQRGYKHLEFQEYLFPGAFDSDDNDRRDEMGDKTLTYEELLPELIKRFHQYFEGECEQFHEAICKAKEFHPKDDETASQFNDRIIKQLKELGEQRMDAAERLKIKKYMDEMGNYVYRSDLTDTVQKALLKRKALELKLESSSFNCETAPGINYPGDEVISKLQKQLDELKAEKNKKTTTTTAIVHAPPKKEEIEVIGNMCNDRFRKILQEDKKSDIEMVRTLTYRPEYFGPIKMDETFESNIKDLSDLWIRWAGSMEYILDYSSPQFRLVKTLDACGCSGCFGYMERYEPTDNSYNGYIPYYKRLWHKPEFNPALMISADGCKDPLCVLKFEETHFLLHKYYNFKLLKNINADLVPKNIRNRYKKYLEDVASASVPDDHIKLFTDAQAAAALKETDKSFLERVWASIPSWGSVFTCLLKLSAIAAVIGVFLKSVTYLWENKKECANSIGAENEEGTETEEVIEKQLRASTFAGPKALITEEASGYSRGVVAKKNIAKIIPKSIGQSSLQQDHVISQIVCRNTFMLEVTYGDVHARKTRYLRCLGLCDRNFIIIDHYWFWIHSSLCKDPQFIFLKDGVRLEIPAATFDQKRIKKLTNSALYVLSFIDNSLPMFRNIVKFFISSCHTNNIVPQAYLLEFGFNDQGVWTMERSVFNRILRKDDLHISNDDDSESYVNSVYSYPRSGRGLCGSVLVSSGNMSSPILGIHVAGYKDGSLGFAEAVVQESFAPLVTGVLDIEPNILAEGSMDIEPIAYLDGNVFQLGCVEKSSAIYPPPKSRVIPTECAGLITDVTYDVPVLHPKDDRINNAFSPLLEGCKHHTNPCSSMPPNFVSAAVEHYSDLVMAVVKPQRIEVGKLTIEQAVCGFEINKHYEPMAMDTSEGYPWILRRPPGAKNKKWMFDIVQTSLGPSLLDMDEKLRNEISRANIQRENGYVQSPIFTDCLKDIKLPKEKVLIPGKTRIFSVAPVDFTISLRMYTLDFVVGFITARFDVESSVGMDVNSLETNYLIHQMLEYGNNMVCGDYSKFGDQLYASLIISFFGIIASWYKKHSREYQECWDNVYKCFGEETSHSIHLMLNQLYQMIGGMPSGNPLTIMINNACNSMYIRIMWQVIMSRVSLRLMSLTSFSENVRAVECGDDIFMSVKDAVIEHFNGITLQHAFAEFNIKFTNASKSGAMLSHTSIEDINTTFLKCTFVKHPYRNDIWMARLEERAALEICNWTWSTQKDIRASSLEACKAMMNEYFGHGPDKYMMLRRKIIDFWADRGEVIQIPTWQDLDFRIYDT